MINVIVASQNPVKINAAEGGFRQMFAEESINVYGIDVPSDVSAQPQGNPETLRGARNRAENARRANPLADYWVGIEGGVEEESGSLSAFAWIVILSPKQCGKGRTGTFFLPTFVANLLKQGYELGEVDDMVFGKMNSKQDNGAIGLLTANVLNRTKLYEHAVILALLPFKNPEIYQSEK